MGRLCPAVWRDAAGDRGVAGVIFYYTPRTSLCHCSAAECWRADRHVEHDAQTPGTALGSAGGIRLVGSRCMTTCCAKTPVPSGGLCHRFVENSVRAVIF